MQNKQWSPKGAAALIEIVYTQTAHFSHSIFTHGFELFHTFAEESERELENIYHFKHFYFCLHENHYNSEMFIEEKKTSLNKKTKSHKNGDIKMRLRLFLSPF